MARKTEDPPKGAGRSYRLALPPGLHHAVLDAPSDALSALTTIHRELDGDTNVLANKRAGNPPTPDLVHDELGCLIEVDEKQHFTSARLLTFEYYPPDCEFRSFTRRDPRSTPHRAREHSLRYRHREVGR